MVEIYRDLRRELGDGVPIIVSGDFNGVVNRERGEKEFLPLLDNTDLEDVFRVLGANEQDSMTQIQFGRSGAVWLLQIDYIFISRNLKSRLLPEETFVFRYRSDLGVKLSLPQNLDQRLLLPSDHYPVVATFSDFS